MSSNAHKQSLKQIRVKSQRLPGKSIVPNAYNSLVTINNTRTHLDRDPPFSAKCAYLSCWVLTPHGGKEGHCKEVLGPLQVFFPGLLREQMKTFRQIKRVCLFYRAIWRKGEFLHLLRDISDISCGSILFSHLEVKKLGRLTPLQRGIHLHTPLQVHMTPCSRGQQNARLSPSKS